MPKWLKIPLWIAALLLAFPVLVVGIILIGLNTEPGRALAEAQIASLTGDTVRLKGLSGRFPDHLRLAHLEIRDTTGAWLQADDVALDWSPLSLLHRQALIHNLQAAHLHFARLPASEPTPVARSSPSKPFTLPVRVTIENLALPRADLGQALLGAPATLALTGHGELPSLETGTATLQATRRDALGTYALEGQVTPDEITAQLDITEPENGLLVQLAALPAIGPLHLQATTAGPRSALATNLTLTAGALTARAHGTIDSLQNAATVDLAAQAPAMRPSPTIAWNAITLTAHSTGPFTAPEVTGHLHLEALEVAGAALNRLDADLAGNAGQATLTATADSLRIPGPRPSLLAGAPLHLAATARLDDPARPVQYSLTHPLLTLIGTATTASNPTAEATLTLPDLAPFGALASIDLAGHTTLAIHAAQTSGAVTLAADGTLALTAGPAPAPALIGHDAKIAVAATIEGAKITLSRATLNGAAITLDAKGTNSPDALDLTAKINATNLTLIAPTLDGAAQLDAHLHGPTTDIALDATLAGTVGVPGVPKGPVRVTAALTGLPAAPTGHITAQGTLAGAPLELALQATKDPNGTLQATIDRADWRTLHAEGDLHLTAGATIPQGHATFRFANLADLRPFIAQPIAGSLTATLNADASTATLEAEARNAGLPGTKVAHATLHARVTDPLTSPTLAATLSADGIEASSTTGSANLEAHGSQEALALKTAANLTFSGTPAQIAATALLDIKTKQLRLNTLQVEARPPSLQSPEILRLLAPAILRYAESFTIDRLRLGLRQATLDVTGRLSPTLDATATLRAPADLAAIVSPTLGMDGAIAVDARLTGTPALPTGTLKLAATGMRLKTGPGRALPPANLTASAQLAGTNAKIDARLTAGSAALGLTGQAAVSALNLRATGNLDLTLLDPILTAQGRRIRGNLALDTTITGPPATPRLSGTAQLTGGEVEDLTQGVRLTNVVASLRADNDTIRIGSLTARAGPGTIVATGTIGALAPGLPIDLAVTLRNARPLASDTISADLDADVTLKGQASAPAGLAAGGKIVIRRAELQIPSTLPASVAVLNVRRPGDRPPAPTAPAAPIALDLSIDAPGQIYLRGRGVDAELSGSLRIRGTSTTPQVGGGLEMRRGAISIAGTTLTFSRGKVGFDGTGISGKIDPTLDFAADSTAAGTTATLAITGYVSKPKITLSSVPDLPQDEVLAYLVFKRSAKDLGPFQIAQIAAGLAELSGVGGGGASFNPLESVRKGLGLDRLSVGSGGTTGITGASTSTSTAAATPTVEAGRYVANGVYVGAKQGTSGNQTQATVQIDITKGLKLETDVGSGQGGNQVGVTYQFEY